ncbi:mechanosensitive ion channel domain-containing protein [Ningiella sp. W23]|uniref:mechanosensitive ion channel family protein n=1 Tax=Ningiella sp. W23 TaxID=3023715 RepID=UPI003756E01A
MNHLFDWIPITIATILVVSVLMAMRWFLLVKHSELSAEQRLPRQLVMVIAMLIGLVIISLSLPVSESSRNQVLTLIGVLVSGVIAFSSTSIVANLMAGLVLRFNKPFRTGDFIRCNEYFGRVSEKGLLDTEIQTEQRDLIAIANSYLVNNPVSVIRSSGTLVTANVSIGYDVHHSDVGKALKQAALNSGLTEAFSHVTELGDFSVSYRVSGLLSDVKSLLSAKSKLHKAMLDELHNRNIEIMSPNYIAQRPTDASQRFIAKAKAHEDKAREDKQHESLAFDKAEEAEQQEQSLERLQTLIKSLREALSAADKDSKPEIENKIQAALERVEKLKSKEIKP